MLFTPTLSKELGKLLYLSDQSMRRMTNAMIWDSVQNLCLAIKSMFSTQSCVCNLGSLKIHLFFLNERWYKLWLKIAITCFSSARFTCKIISLFAFDISKPAKFVSLRPKLEIVLAPVSYRSSSRRRQRKRLLLKVRSYAAGSAFRRAKILICCLKQVSSTPNNLMAIWVTLCAEQALLSYIKRGRKLEYIYISFFA